MELNLAPQTADATVIDVDGGAYYAWTPEKSPILTTAKMGAGKLVLQPRGFALPHYADSAKIGYVIQGECTVGFILPNSQQEQILIIKKGDAIPVLLGTISWWFNGGDSDVVIVYLGETSLSYSPGLFSYFFLSGAIGFLPGFSLEFVTKIYSMTEDEAKKLSKSQTAALIVKLDGQLAVPRQSTSKKTGVFASVLDEGITSDNFPLLEKAGLSASFVRLPPDSVLPPEYTTDGSGRMIYVIKGSGRVQIVRLNGVLVLDANVEEGELFVVPRFFAAALIADGKGMEFFSVITSSRPELGNLGGKLSPWKALSSSVVQATLNVDLKFVEFFKSKLGFEGDHKHKEKN